MLLIALMASTSLLNAIAKPITAAVAKMIPSATEPPRPAAGRLGLPRFGNGGIVTSATLALVGEKGPEAIVPLDRMQSGGGITINVTGGLATSAEIGESVVNALRAYSRSAGPLQLQVA